MVEHEGGSSFYTDPAEREAAWQRDRATEETPLPGAELSHYPTNDRGALRQSALYHAEQANIAAAAREVGATSAEWLAKRSELGRSPTRADFPQSA